MKKVIALTLVGLTLAVSLCGCGSECSDASEFDEVYEMSVTLQEGTVAELENIISGPQNTTTAPVQHQNVCSVGDIIILGQYEQDNNTANGTEPIEWEVVAVENGKALVISKYALDRKPYNEYDTGGGATWEDCTLRKWLNHDFFNSAFSADEKARIHTVTVSADKNPEYSTDPGNATQDQVFLLSIIEAEQYFSSKSERECRPTDYVDANGIWEDDDGDCWWWLRTPGSYLSRTVCVGSGGGIVGIGDFVGGAEAVRPALWIDLNS